MLHWKKPFLSTLIVSLAACSSGTVNNTDAVSSPTTDATNSPATDVASSSQPTNPPPNVTIPGVSNVGEINFKPSSKNSSGFFDGINGSTAPKLEVPKATTLTASGWAILTDSGKVADNVVITYGDSNSLLAVAPVNGERTDVVKVLKNPAYTKSGWSAAFNSSNLPAGSVVIKAWAYDSQRKQAIQLEPTHEVTVSQ